MFKRYTSIKLLLIAIFLLAAFFRLYGINWDQGAHLHPDERAIIMAVIPLTYPQSIEEFLSPESTWNPHFFAYGSFPFYLLKITGNALGNLDIRFTQYALIQIAGRYLSVISDLFTLVLVFKLGRRLFHPTVGLLGAFFYAISVLPIQLSHFYAVDTLLTSFILLTLYQLIRFYEKPSLPRALFVGIFWGLALATKISAIVLILSIGFAVIADFLLLFLKQPHKPRIWLPHIPKFLKQLCTYFSCIIVSTCIIFLLCEPYAIIDSKNFLIQTWQQSAMTANAFIFPYTLQYVGKIPYVYEIKNIFLFGLGPVLGLLVFAGVFYFTLLTFQKDKRGKWAKEIILLIFFFTYSAVVGKFAIGFMRYMLPVYPLLCLFGAITIYKLSLSIKKNIPNTLLFHTLSIIFYLLVLLWPLSFIHIYTKNNTRIDASNWIYQNIPDGSSLAIEHWDDPIPILGTRQYKMLILPMYDPDSPQKWEKINDIFRQTDYIIIASNRLYTPLQKLTDCQKLPPGKCYPVTAEYYQRLFSGENVSPSFNPENNTLRFQRTGENIRFTKIMEFTNYPTVPFLNLSINDQSADESFTVYDHPKIMILKKME
jgi:hypothetical protein